MQPGGFLLVGGNSDTVAAGRYLRLKTLVEHVQVLVGRAQENNRVNSGERD
jgi:hypothetical protein